MEKQEEWVKNPLDENETNPWKWWWVWVPREGVSYAKLHTAHGIKLQTLTSGWLTLKSLISANGLFKRAPAPPKDPE